MRARERQGGGTSRGFGVLCSTQMLRPSNSLLGSSRAARRANVRAERTKALGNMAKGSTSAVFALWGGVIELALLWLLPLIYLASSYLALDLPARWLWHVEPFSGWKLLLFLGAFVVCLVGLARALQGAEPIVPVRPRFARIMLAVAWFASLLLTISDVATG